MYRVLGTLTVLLMILVTSPWWVRMLARRVLRLPGAKVNPLIKKLRLIHKPLGAALLVIAAAHGYLALRALQLHTGTLAYLALLTTAILGIAFAARRKPPIFKWHKRAALLTVLLILLHLIAPGALNALLR